MPIRLDGGRLRRGIFLMMAKLIPPVETGGYDVDHA